MEPEVSADMQENAQISGTLPLPITADIMVTDTTQEVVFMVTMDTLAMNLKPIQLQIVIQPIIMPHSMLQKKMLHTERLINRFTINGPHLSKEESMS